MHIDSSITQAKIIDWIITLTIGITIYLLFQRGSLKVSRLKAVAELEADIAEIHASMTAFQQVQPSGGQCDSTDHEFRFILDNEPDWTHVEDTEAVPYAGFRSPICIQRNGVRYWQVRDFLKDGIRIQQYVASSALHHSLLWFRRADRALNEKILLPGEIADWWRQVLPMSWSGRLEYYRKYFQGHDDIASVTRVMTIVILELSRAGHQNAIAYCKYFNGNDRDVLSTIGRKGKRAVSILPKH
ncbi:MAG TPA: hypothetical protein VNW97_03010 [Candidatus Saccharimonadales bacterium]|nr:hypothetical protein [Candidatus Saccharimonadales bacterium]